MPQDAPMKNVVGIDAQSRVKLLQNCKKFRIFVVSMNTRRARSCPIISLSPTGNCKISVRHRHCPTIGIRAATVRLRIPLHAAITYNKAIRMAHMMKHKKR